MPGRINPLVRAYHNYKVKTVKERLQHDLRVAKKGGNKQAIEEAFLHLTMFYEASEALEDLAKLLEEVVAEEKAALGPASPQRCLTLGRLAFTYERLGNLTKAEDQLKEVLEIQRKGNAPPSVLVHQMNVLANLYIKEKKFEAAEALFKECLALLTSTGQELNSTGAVLANLASLYQEWGQYEKALDYLRQEKELVKKFLGADSVMVTRPMIREAELYAAWPGRTFDAIKTYEEVLAFLEKAQSPDVRLKLTTLEAICSCGAKVGDEAKQKWAKDQMQAVLMADIERGRDRVGQQLSTEVADQYRSRVEQDIQRDLSVIKLNIEHLKRAPVQDVMAHSSVVMSFIQRLNNKKAFDESFHMYQLLVSAIEARPEVAPEVLFTPLMNTAFLAIRMEKWDEARKTYNKALTLAERHLPPIQLGQAYYDIGHLLISNPKTKEEGMKLYERAASMVTQLHEKGKLSGEALRHLSTGPVLGAFALTGRSAVAFMLRKMANDFIHVEQGRGNALSMLTLALTLLEEDAKSEETRDLAILETNVALRAKALVYVEMKDKDLALEVLQDAVAALLKIADRAELKPVVQEHLVQTYVELSDQQDVPEERKATIEKAMAVAKEHFGVKSPLHTEVCHALARLQVSMKDWAGARATLDNILAAEDELLFLFDPRRVEAIALLKEVCTATNDTAKLAELQEKEADFGQLCAPLRIVFMM